MNLPPITNPASFIPTDLYQTGGGGGILSRLTSGLGDSSFPGAFLGPKALGGTGEFGLGKLAVGPILGTLAGSAVENLGKPDSTSGDIAQAFGTGLKTAGLGASVGAPFEVIGAIPGAIGGFAVGFGGSLAHSLFGGGTQQGPSADQLKGTLGTLAAQATLDPGTYQQMFDTYKTLGIQGTTTDAKGNQVSTGKPATDQEIAQKILGQVQQDAAAKQQNQQQLANTYLTNQANAQYQMALQAQAQDFFAPYGNAILQSGIEGSKIMKNLASTAPPGYRDIWNNQADMMANDALRTYGAYGAQIAAAPWLQYQNTTVQQQAKSQQQMYDMMRVLYAGMNKNQGGSSQNFSDLANSLQSGTAGQSTGP